ncbi:MAG: RNA polymerase factor sigma-54 [Chitinophagaceae bacterium]|nr:RNA polymerase factor sigma-54 [Chitinophagaceae bacterium]
MLHQNLSQRQQLKILPQQIQLLNLFHLNTIELEHRIQQELEENPLLEENASEEITDTDKYNKEAVQDYKDWDEYGYDDVPDYKTEYENYFNSEKIPERPIPEATDFREALKQQFKLMYTDEREIMLADYLIDSLNENGMLDNDLADIADDLSFRYKNWLEVAELETVLHKIQQLEPAGIGARSIRESLLLQLNRMNTKRPDVKMAIRLLEEHFTDLGSRNMDKIMHHLQIEDDELKIILQLLASLKMKPISGGTDSFQANQQIMPDFIITLDGGELEVSLYRQRSASLHINQNWMESVKTSEESAGTDKATRQYLRNKLNAAQWFVSAIKQRESTMLKVVRAIVKLQHDYFLEGDIKLIKPMILKNIAEMVGVDISTVSRITCNKYVSTPFGTLLLKDLFTEGIINKQGETISNRVIQTAIEEVIETEDKQKPFTDQQLVSILSQKGFSIARRTVAKYRELLQIPVAQMRALWA